ncbi:unnamed protein product [Nezara viridula]|uniref:Uncharacterized protein n=1 Tax=Nezara viridula TaxID=85310 RepID=A0A9P0HBT9_NEZVI|nr:unnamed protein product [Nezara viridula]
MSRMQKKEVENVNPRRKHTIMSSEEAGSGKKSNWTEMEITGTIRNLSSRLWDWTHLTSLYLNDNCLSRLPPDIGKLVNLRVLDLSCNKLRSLPAELGELIYLRELLLNNNLLRSLPYELGKLFQLQILGLAGNPLSKECLKMYNEPNGTSKLITYLLDSLQGASFLLPLKGIEIPKNLKLSVYNAMKPVLLYGCEACTLTSTLENLERCDRKILCTVTEAIWDQSTNREQREKKDQ